MSVRGKTWINNRPNDRWKTELFHFTTLEQRPAHLTKQLFYVPLLWLLILHTSTKVALLNVCYLAVEKRKIYILPVWRLNTFKGRAESQDSNLQCFRNKTNATVKAESLFCDCSQQYRNMQFGSGCLLCLAGNVSQNVLVTPLTWKIWHSGESVHSLWSISLQWPVTVYTKAVFFIMVIPSMY